MQYNNIIVNGLYCCNRCIYSAFVQSTFQYCLTFTQRPTNIILFHSCVRPAWCEPCSSWFQAEIHRLLITLTCQHHQGSWTPPSQPLCRHINTPRSQHLLQTTCRLASFDLPQLFSVLLSVDLDFLPAVFFCVQLLVANERTSSLLACNQPPVYEGPPIVLRQSGHFKYVGEIERLGNSLCVWIRQRIELSLTTLNTIYSCNFNGRNLWMYVCLSFNFPDNHSSDQLHTWWVYCPFQTGTGNGQLHILGLRARGCAKCRVWSCLGERFLIQLQPAAIPEANLATWPIVRGSCFERAYSEPHHSHRPPARWTGPPCFWSCGVRH